MSDVEKCRWLVMIPGEKWRFGSAATRGCRGVRWWLVLRRLLKLLVIGCSPDSTISSCATGWVFNNLYNILTWLDAADCTTCLQRIVRQIDNEPREVELMRTWSRGFVVAYSWAANRKIRYNKCTINLYSATKTHKVPNVLFRDSVAVSEDQTKTR